MNAHVEKVSIYREDMFSKKIFINLIDHTVKEKKL